MLEIFRRIDGSYSILSFLKGWLILMTPFGVTTWIFSKSIILSIFSFVAIPLYGVVQGAILIFAFRSSYGDCPLPKTPAHGIVVVNPVDADPDQEIKRELGQNCSCSCSAGRRWRRGAVSPSEKFYLDLALQQTPLRLLVIGDSLALGLGVTSSCTAILPEVIAKALSKSFRRPVFWTVHGSPGASSGWIARELQRDSDTRYKAPNITFSDVERLHVTDSSSGETSDDVENSTGYGEWGTRLKQWKSSDLGGPYDVVVIMTGANDVKGSLFPILVRGEECEFALRRGFSLTSELEHILKCLRPLMNTATKPLIVLPAMPTSLLPIFRTPPVRWHALPVMGIMEHQKKQFAAKYDDCLFLEAPDLKISKEFEAQTGFYWEKRLREDTLLALRDVSKRECEYIYSRLQKYCDLKRFPPLYPKGTQSQINYPEPPLSKRNEHLDGSKVVFIDKVHPNDEGFDLWGRHIADGIIKNWPNSEMEMV
jgi:lysophospholipase L1-like esterase